MQIGEGFAVSSAEPKIRWRLHEGCYHMKNMMEAILEEEAGREGNPHVLTWPSLTCTGASPQLSPPCGGDGISRSTSPQEGFPKGDKNLGPTRAQFCRHDCEMSG